MESATTVKAIAFETSPSRYRHWTLEFDGPLAILSMNVAEDSPLVPDYTLKLNSYDLGVDIELADALQRIRFEHPAVHALVITSLKERIFCAGANIFMLGGSSHAFKVNFCKFTNETRLAIEDMSEHSSIRSLAAVNGICAGGGYELALACDEIVLVDDGNSAVSLPEAPLLGVLPGTGGLTRVVDKRKVRRDRADLFSTLVEGVKGKRAVDWRLVDKVYPTSQFREKVRARALELAAMSDRPSSGPGISLGPLNPRLTGDEIAYRYVTVRINRGKRVADLTMRGPENDQPSKPDDVLAAGDDFWLLRAFRELDDALLWLRFNEPEIGTLVIRTEGDVARVLAVDRTIAEYASAWHVREIRHFVKRVLKRLDLTARTVFAFIEPGSCFAGTLFELALAADRSYMLNDPDRPTSIHLSRMNAGLLPMGNGLSRLQVRFLAEPSTVDDVLGHEDGFNPEEALDRGLVTSAPDDLDWEDEVRLAIEERAALSPDALTGLEANLRFAGPETMETKIFGRLSAWQNWIFQRPNAVGERGALRVYGREGRPEFDWRRT